MTVATYTSDLTTVFLFESTTGVSAYGGGGAGLGTGADFVMEGALCVDKQITSAEKGFLHIAGSNYSIGADDHFFVWINVATPGLCDTRNNRGIVACIGDSDTDFVKFHVNGSDTLPLGGGLPYAIRYVNTTLANFRTLVGSPSTTPRAIGGGANTTASVKGANLGVDGARKGTGYDILYGTGADPRANFTALAANSQATSQGVFRESATVGFELQGKLRFGSASVPCELTDSDKFIAIKDTRHSLTDFTELLFNHASTVVNLTRITFQAAGTNNRGRFEVLVSSIVCNLTSCAFNATGVTILGTGSTCLDCVWVAAGIVTANGATLTGSTITQFGGTANTSGLIWDVATDPDGKLDNMRFTKGTVDTHAIEFGTSSPLSITIRGWTTSGYSASNNQNSSTFHVKRTSGTVTINVIGGTGNFSYRTDGATVNIVLSPVNTRVLVKDENGDALENARVIIEAADGTGDLPYEEAVTSILRVATLATVTHPSHGLVTGDKVKIEGADQQEYNGVKAISIATAATYTFTVTGSPTSPATGTIIATGVVLEGLTDVAGEISQERSYSTDQNIIYRIAMATTSPLYKRKPDGDADGLSATIDNVTGLTIREQMIRDD